MALKWKEQFSTGVWWQDKQHREVFTRLNRLLTAMEDRSGRDEISALFEELEDYVARHFSSQEGAMERSSYSGKKVHAAEHRRFMGELAAIRAEFEDGAAIALVIRVQRQLVDWLVGHIGNVDKALGAYLRAEEMKQEAAVNC